MTTKTDRSFIDLRSDTVTTPSEDMRRAMASAEVGDDVLDGDPTTRRLESTVADMLGHDAALFMPSGTQANQVAIGLTCSPGSEIILAANAHIVQYEQSGASALWGAHLRTIDTETGVLDPAAVRALIRPDGPFHPETRLVTIENTNNYAGGRVAPLENMQALAAVAAEAGVSLHLDGARLWNAAEALGVDISAIATLADMVMVSFSKGLGAPVGSCLCGPDHLLTSGVELRRRLGGGMRQSGVLAAACLWALEHNLDRLREDRLRAAEFAATFSDHPAVSAIPPDTNIVMLELKNGRNSRHAQQSLRDAGVLFSVFGATRLRAVMHLGVTDQEIARAADIAADVLAERAA